MTEIYSIKFWEFAEKSSYFPITHIIGKSNIVFWKNEIVFIIKCLRENFLFLIQKKWNIKYSNKKIIGTKMLYFL
jgi:hypothetical protein